MDAKFRCKQNLETLPGKKHLHCKRQEDLILRDDSEHDLQFYLKVKGREIWNFSAIFTIQLIHFPEVIFLASPAVFPLNTICGLLFGWGTQEIPSIFAHNLQMISHTLLMIYTYCFWKALNF